MEGHGIAELKESGNESFKAGDFAVALEKFTAALDRDEAQTDAHNAAVLYCNRSQCHANLGDFGQSVADAKRAVSLDGKYQKAHYRLVKSLVEMGRLREARQYLLIALKDVGETKELKALEAEIDKMFGTPLRPKPGDFDILSELGDGNFSKIYKAALKTDPSKVYAIKVIELMTVERMQRRHRNINNEIHMEKRVLNKLDHPSIVTLYATFRDYGSLYYQMEYLEGGELFERLHERHGGIDYAVGLHQSLARAIMAQAINALEYMHRRGIVHRDIKPENMVLTASGHLKFVDFGTAKDLVQTDLNGPEFVGTPDYMSPLAVSSKSCGPDSDLWALGVVMYQMVTGFTPFGGASPYMSFLRIKRALVRVPQWASPETQSLLQTLLTKNATDRLSLATGFLDGAACLKGGAAINYDALRRHGYFSYRHKDDIATVEGARSAHERPAAVIPRLTELCLRAVGQAATELAAATAAAGGVRPSEQPWMQSFDLFKLSPSDRGAIAHYLLRRNALHAPGVLRLFCTSLVDARCIRVDMSTREYIGHSRILQGQWEEDFFFAQLADPQFGMKAGMSENGHAAPSTATATATATAGAGAGAVPGSYTGGSEWDNEMTRLKQAVVAINRLRPRFVVVSGDLSHAMPGEPMYEAQTEAFRKTIARVSDSIPLLFLPGNHDVGNEPTVASLDAYRQRFGADYYGFWFGGLRCLVLNSTLMLRPDALPVDAQAQDEWLAEEIELAKLGAAQVLIFTHHPWFVDSVHEEDSCWNIPKTTRHKWLRRLQHAKVSYAFAGHCHRAHGGGKAFPGAVVKYKPKKVRVKVNKAGAAKTAGEEGEDGQGDGDQEKEGDGEEESRMDVSLVTETETQTQTQTETELLTLPPAAGGHPGTDDGSADGSKPGNELEHESAEIKGTACDDGSNGSKVPASASASASSSVNTNSKDSKSGDNSSDDDDDDDYDDADGHGSEDDEEHDWGYAPDERDEDGKVAFKNVQRDFQGPTVVVTNSVGLPLDDGPPGLRLVLVRENKVSHKYYGLDALPKEVVLSSGRGLP